LRRFWFQNSNLWTASKKFPWFPRWKNNSRVNWTDCLPHEMRRRKGDGKSWFEWRIL